MQGGGVSGIEVTRALCPKTRGSKATLLHGPSMDTGQSLNGGPWCEPLNDPGFDGA
jgi:hypothetical protein